MKLCIASYCFELTPGAYSKQCSTQNIALIAQVGTVNQKVNFVNS